MRIFVHDYGSYAFPVQLSRALAQRGHQVLHLHSAHMESKGRLWQSEDDPASFDVRKVKTDERYVKYDFIKRRAFERSYGRAVVAEIASFKPDIVLNANCPLETAVFVQRHCKAAGILYVHWMQDIHAVAMQAILPKKLPIIGSAIAAYYTNVERRMVAAADAVVIIADEFADELHKLRMQPKRAATIPNWMPLDEMKPGEKINPWSIKNGLDKTTNIIYFGSVGLKQDEDLYVKFSEHFRPMREVRVVVIGGGYVMKGLKQQKVEKGLDNLVLLGWQSYEDVADILATGDVLLAAVNAQASLYSVPCKVLTYLSAGRPIIAAIPPANLVAKILIQNDMGLVVDPSNVDDVIRTADRLMRDAGLRQKFSELGRAYALRTFNIDTICSRFEGLFREV